MKKISKVFGTVIIIIFILISGCFYYAFFVEPFRVVSKQINLNEHEDSTVALKIVQFSDTHIKKDFKAHNLDKVVAKINEMDPDIIVFSGDLYDNYAFYNDNQNLIKVLGSLKAKYAKLAVWGNRDIGGGAVRIYESLMQQSGFNLLRNSEIAIKAKGKTVGFYGIDDQLLGNPTFKNITDDNFFDYSFLVMHEGDTIESFQNFGFDMALAGHSHGGQIKLPFINGISTALGDKYRKGLYKISDKLHININSGIGTTRISARFLVSPELSVFKLYL